MLKNKLKIILPVIIFSFGVFIWFINSKREIRNINSSGKNIICFGDSITFGYGVNPGQDYPAALAKILNRRVINAGEPGDSSVEGIKRLKADVLEKKPYIVFIEFSGNDFIRKVPMNLTVSNIDNIVREIQSAGAMTAIVDVSAGLFLMEYRIRLFKIARETGSIFIPAVLRGIITNPSLKSDFMHPNASGYKIVAERIHQAVRPYLDKSKNKNKPVGIKCRERELNPYEVALGSF